MAAAFSDATSMPAICLLGVYRNSELNGDSVFVCEDGIYISSGDGVYIHYSEIKSVKYESVGEMISLVMKTGVSHVLRISGRSGKFYDSTEFVRFFDRALSDV